MNLLSATKTLKVMKDESTREKTPNHSKHCCVAQNKTDTESVLFHLSSRIHAHTDRHTLRGGEGVPRHVRQWKASNFLEKNRRRSLWKCATADFWVRSTVALLLCCSTPFLSLPWMKITRLVFVVTAPQRPYFHLCLKLPDCLTCLVCTHVGQTYTEELKYRIRKEQICPFTGMTNVF